MWFVYTGDRAWTWQQKQRACSSHPVSITHLTNVVIFSVRKTTKNKKGGVGWVVCVCVCACGLRGSKIQPRLLHHPINYSHRTMFFSTVCMTHTLRKISRVVKSMGIG